MFISTKYIPAVLLLASAASAANDSFTTNELQQQQSRKLYPSCMVPGSFSCSNPDDACDEINGHKYWTVTQTGQSNSACSTRCVAESDLEFMLDQNYECGPCTICPSDMRCKMDDKDSKFSIFRIKSDGKCEEKCEKEEKVQEKFDKDEGYACGFCPFSVENASTLYDPEAVPPAPDKCTLKRALEIMRYEPNWPAAAKEAGEPGAVVQIDIKAGNSGTIYEYPVDYDYSKSEMYIVDKDQFYDMYNAAVDKNEQTVYVRFVSARGPGGWTSCNYSPIAIDLNRDGEITRLQAADVGREGWEVDITGDGELEFLNEWFGPEDGILVDLSGKYELFEEEAAKTGRRLQELVITGVQLLGDQGGQYANGFQKLANRDRDMNGILENKELVGLHIWLDANSNARLDDGELSNLADHGIAGLRVTHTGMKSTAIMRSGNEILMEDIWLN